MSTVSTHVLDLVRGAPAVGVPVVFERLDDADGWILVTDAVTDADGRIRELLPEGSEAVGTFRLVFDTGAWFESQGTVGFYPSVSVLFALTEARHYHVPLLLGPYGYSTYRGS